MVLKVIYSRLYWIDYALSVKYFIYIKYQNTGKKSYWHTSSIYWSLLALHLSIGWLVADNCQLTKIV